MTIGKVVGRGRGVRRPLVWGVPVLVAGVVAAGAWVAAPSSGAVPNLPARSAAQLLTDVREHAATTFSGEVREVANLGIPSLPGSDSAASSASLSWQTFVTGSHTARVWSDGPDKQRSALVGELSEADVTHNGRDVWTYTSAQNTVTHLVLPAHSARTDRTPATATPGAAADKLLKAIDPSTAVSVSTAQRVAGRAAYTLVLRPRDTRSTVRSVRIAIDATKHLPLRVQVFGTGSAPALQIGFTSVSFARPAASTFHFVAPKGATVSNQPFADHRAARAGWHGHAGKHPMHTGKHPMRPGQHPMRTGITAGPAISRMHPAGRARPTVLGSGWTSVVELHGGASALGGEVDHLTTAVGSSGMRLLHTALINAVVRSDGSVFAGAVTPALLEHIASTTH